MQITGQQLVVQITHMSILAKDMVVFQQSLAKFHPFVHQVTFLTLQAVGLVLQDLLVLGETHCFIIALDPIFRSHLQSQPIVDFYQQSLLLLIVLLAFTFRLVESIANHVLLVKDVVVMVSLLLVHHLRFLIKILDFA